MSKCKCLQHAANRVDDYYSRIRPGGRDILMGETPFDRSHEFEALLADRERIGKSYAGYRLGRDSLMQETPYDQITGIMNEEVEDRAREFRARRAARHRNGNRPTANKARQARQQPVYDSPDELSGDEDPKSDRPSRSKSFRDTHAYHTSQAHLGDYFYSDQRTHIDTKKRISPLEITALVTFACFAAAILVLGVLWAYKNLIANNHGMTQGPYGYGRLADDRKFRGIDQGHGPRIVAHGIEWAPVRPARIDVR